MGNNIIRFPRDGDNTTKKIEREGVETDATVIKLVMDLEEAQRFLKLLGEKHTFQTFDDDRDRRKNDETTSMMLSIKKHGELDWYADQLCTLNSVGAGVFATLNETDYKGKCKENIKRIRAVTLDLDGEPLEPVKTCKLQPHIIVESSPGKYHCYWLVKDLPCHQFEDVQRSIAKAFDGDPSVALLTHNARMPGFYHCKKKPFFRTRILEVNEREKYEAEEILKEFPPLKKAHKPLGSRKGRAVLWSRSPVESAIAFGKHVYVRDGALCLVACRGNFYQWPGSHYEQLGDDMLRSKVYEFLNKAATISKKENNYMPFNPTQAKVNNVIDALKALVALDSRQSPPFWFGPMAHVQGSYIAFRNGLLDIDKRELIPHSPYYFNLHSVPFDYDPKAAEPLLWTKFLRELWPADDGDDETSRLLLQEMFGLMLTGDTRFQKIFLMIGPKRSGRGTIARVLTAMLGRDNVVNPTLADLSTQFGPASLIGKQAAIISDARLGSQTNSHAVAERLLAFSGEDGLTIDRKHKEPWTGKLDILFLILSNELPRIADASGATASRFVVLKFFESFYGREDKDLTEKLSAELPGILNWALAGLDRLRKRGRFVMPKSAAESIQELGDLGAPVKAFVTDWCETGFTDTIKVKEVYKAYRAWCEEHGHTAGNDQSFGKDLRAALPHLNSKGHGSRRSYVGLRLSTDGEKEYQDYDDNLRQGTARFRNRRPPQDS